MHATPATPTAFADEVQARREALGWSQNELARRIKKDPGLVSRVLSGAVTSAIVRARIEKALGREERRRARRTAA
jgi:ribosome-binding protein aMBF1 (putative translation factor)